MQDVAHIAYFYYSYIAKWGRGSFVPAGRDLPGELLIPTTKNNNILLEENKWRK
jgi:hypothetical protein